jgi:hypothetical protein
MNGISKEHFLGECCICYKELFLEANHIVTECKHLFCIKCILKWYNLSNTCPICREELYENTWDEPEYTDISLGNIYLEDDDVDSYSNGSIYTVDWDDGRFDTIDDYLEDEYTWTGIVEEDDLQITANNPEVNHHICNIRQDIINLIKYHTYKQCILLPKEFNGNISQKMINRNKYADFPDMDNLSNLPSAPENIFEIVMKNTESIEETHHFGRIKGKKMVNKHFVEHYSDGTSCNRCSLEYVFVLDLIAPLYSPRVDSDEFVVINENAEIMFIDIRRMYEISPCFISDN